jgi:hypothetical protein
MRLNAEIVLHVPEYSRIKLVRRKGENSPQEWVDIVIEDADGYIEQEISFFGTARQLNALCPKDPVYQRSASQGTEAGVTPLSAYQSSLENIA